MVASLEQTFSQTGTFDENAVNSVPLRSAKPRLDNPFSDNEVNAAARKIWRTANQQATLSAQRNILYKALAEDECTKVYLREVMNAY